MTRLPMLDEADADKHAHANHRPFDAAQRPMLTTWARSLLAVDTPLIALPRVTLIDGTGAPASEDQTIVLRDGRIESVGPRGRIAIPAAAKILDLKGHTVIPGLVGLHEHTYLGGISRTSPMLHSALLYLAAGVTTAMTAGSMQALCGAAAATATENHAATRYPLVAASC